MSLPDLPEENKIQSYIFKCCNREYKLIHFKKTKVNSIFNYIGLMFYLIKKFYNKIIPIIHKTKILHVFETFLKINLLLSIFLITFIVLYVIFGVCEYNQVYHFCNNDFRNCDTYKNYCYKSVDDHLIYHDNILYKSRKKEIEACINNNLYVFHFIKNSLFDFVKILYNIYSYAIPIYIILYYGYYLYIYMTNKINNMYNKVIIQCNKELPIVEEV